MRHKQSFTISILNCQFSFWCQLWKCPIQSAVGSLWNNVHNFPPVVIVFVSLGLMDNAESRISVDNRIKCVYRFVDPPLFITEKEKKHVILHYSHHAQWTAEHGFTMVSVNSGVFMKWITYLCKWCCLRSNLSFFEQI